VIKEEEWYSFFKNLYTNNKNVHEEINPTLIEVDNIEFNELNEIINNMKNKKAIGIDNMNIELLKYAPTSVKYRFLDIINIYWKTYQIPKSWLTALITPIFKKGE
jgi:hypothetical protein